MKLTNNVVSILKNFSGINQSIVVKAGSNLQTISNMKDVFAKVEIEEKFPADFAIYDLGEFLGVVNLFEDPNLEFGKKSVVISEGSARQEYFYAEPSNVTQPPENGVTLPSVEVKARLSRQQLGQLLKAASTNGSTDLTFKNGDVKVHDRSIPNSNSFTIEGVADHEEDYSLSIRVESLRLIADDYDIEICAKGLARLAGASGVEYFVALQPDGTYGS